MGLLIECWSPQVFLSRSEASAIARLTSEDELQESSWDEFFLEVLDDVSVGKGIPLVLGYGQQVLSSVEPDEVPAATSDSTLGPGAASHGHTSSIGRAAATSAPPASLATRTLFYDLVFYQSFRFIYTPTLMHSLCFVFWFVTSKDFICFVG